MKVKQEIILNCIEKRDMLNKKAVAKAVKDAVFLLDRRYPKEQVVKLVGDRYKLKQEEGWVLIRGLWDKRTCEKRKRKLIGLGKVKELGIDGYNVLITAQALLNRGNVIFCRDGVVRDVRGVFGKYRITKSTEKTLRKILEKLRGKRLHWYFDSQVSRSGELAGMVRGIMKEMGINGDARTVKVVDRELKKFKIVASSDSAVVDKVKKIVDVPRLFLKKEAYLLAVLIKD